MSDNPFARPNSVDAAKGARTSAASAVQTSLYVRLRGAYPGKSGPVAWALIRATQPGHKECLGALAGLRELSGEELVTLSKAVKATREAAKTSEARELCDAILGELSAAHKAARGVPAPFVAESASRVRASGLDALFQREFGGLTESEIEAKIDKRAAEIALEPCRNCGLSVDHGPAVCRAMKAERDAAAGTEGTEKVGGV